MAVISAKIKLTEDMSKKLDALASKSREVQQMINSIGTSASSFDKVSNGTQSAEEKLSKLSSRAKSAETDLKKCESTSKVTASAVEKMGNDFENSEDAIRDMCQSALDKYNSTVNASTKSTEEFAQAVEVSGDATAGIVDKEGLAELEKLITSTSEAEEELNNLNRTADKSTESSEKLAESQRKTSTETAKATEKTEEFSNKSREAFETLDGLIASAGVVMFLKKVYDGLNDCITAANEYETSLAKVSTLADTSVPMSQIGDDILELSQKTGQAATDLAEAEYQALSAGVATVNSVEFIEQANKLAVGGFTTSATSVDVLTTAINAYQLEANQASRVSDTLIMTQNLGKTTVDELASSMGRVIPSAAAYNVTIDDLSTSYAVMTANGIATAESTTYIKGMLNELAKEGSNVSDVLLEKTGKTFSQLEADGKSLGDVMDILGSSVDYDSTAFANLWSSQEAGTGALALLNAGTEKYNSTLSKMQNSLGTTDEAYKTMTSTAEYTSQKLQNAGTNFQIAVGNVMVPVTNKFNESMTNVLTGLTTFVNEHPGVVQALSSIAISVTVLTAGIAAYTVATKAAKIATVAFTAVMDANPIFLVATAVAAVVAGLITFAASQEEAVEEVEELSAASKAQRDELSQLQSQYDSLCESGQKNSAEAEELKVKIDDLSTSYENNKQTVDELYESHENLTREFNDFKKAREEQVDKINDEEESANNLIDRLSELASKSSLTADEQAEMGVVIDALNRKIPSLGITYSSVASNVEESMNKIKNAVNQDIAQKNYDESYNTYSEAYTKADNLKADRDKLKQELDNAQNDYNNAVTMLEQAKSRKDQLLQDWDFVNWFATGDYEINNWQEHVDSMQQALDEAQTAYDEAANNFYENNQLMESAWDDMVRYSAESYGLITDTENEAQQAVTGIAPTIIQSLTDLATAYDEAYNSALNSFQGQYSLWDEVGNISATSASTLMSNLDSQITYWQNYSSNLESLQKRNIDGLDELLASIDDGSEESAAALAGMANASDTELQKMVDKYGKLQDEQSKTADDVAKLQTDFDTEMGKIAKTAEDTIDGMNLSTEAEAAAKATMDAYINAIKNADVAGAVASKVNSAKNLLTVNPVVEGNAKGTTNSANVFVAGEQGPELVATKAAAYANGTTNSEDFFIAGENGPELIVGQQGSTVFPTSETERLINVLNNAMDSRPIISNEVVRTVESGSPNSTSEKVLTIRLEGAGALSVSNKGGASKDEIVEIMTEQLKPVLIGILNDEIYEEGDDSYEY